MSPSCFAFMRTQLCGESDLKAYELRAKCDFCVPSGTKYRVGDAGLNPSPSSGRVDASEVSGRVGTDRNVTPPPALRAGPSPFRGGINKARAIAPILCGAGYAVVSISPRRRGRGGVDPRIRARERSAERRVRCSPCRARCRARAPLGAPPAASVSAPGRASGGGSWRAAGLHPRPAEPSAISELLAGGRSAPERCPGAARVQEERSSPARGRRIRLHHQDAS